MPKGLTEQPLISVIVPVYNTKEYLPRTVDSLLAQTYGSLEIILVDDGSRDGSGELCEELAQKDGRIRVLHQPNGGVSAARNRGLACAAGGYIGFVDSDDEVQPDFYEVLLTRLVETDSDLAACNSLLREADGRESLSIPLYVTQVISGREAFRRMQYLTDLDSSPCNKLFRRELLADKRFAEGLALYEDYELLNRVLWQARRVVLCEEPLYLYHQHAGSAMHNGFLKAGEALDRMLMETKKLPFLQEDLACLGSVVCFCDTRLMAVVMQLVRAGKTDGERLVRIRESLKGSYRLYRKEKPAPLRFRAGAGMLVYVPQLFCRLAGRLYPGSDGNAQSS